MLEESNHNSEDYYQCVVVRQNRGYVAADFTISKIDFHTTIKLQEDSAQPEEDVYLSSEVVYQQQPLRVNLRQLSRDKKAKQGTFGQLGRFGKQPTQQPIYDDVKIEESVRHEDCKRGPYRVYTPDQKSGAINLINQGVPFRDVSKQLGIPIKNLRRWVSTGGLRKKGGGRKQMDVDMEKQLYKWILGQMRETGKKISRSQIRHQALVFSKFKGKFKASKGWTDKFVRKYNLKRAAMKERIFGGSVKDDSDQEIEVVLQEQQLKLEPTTRRRSKKYQLSIKSTAIKPCKLNDSPIINFENFFKI